MFGNHIVGIRGGGDIATGIAHRLYKSGFKIIIFEMNKPSLIRRKVAFAQAIYENEVDVEGVKAKLVNNIEEGIKEQEEGLVPVIIDPEGKNLYNPKITIIVDAILAKKNLGTNKDMAHIVIGVGPGFTAGKDVHAVVESNRGHNLGRVIYNGSPEPNTGIPGNIKGFTEKRVIRANQYGKLSVIKDIGSIVEKDEVLATIDGVEVKAKIDGVIRGMIQNGFEVVSGMKIGDIDPRGIKNNCITISDKARTIGGGVLEGICHLLNEK
ncbi:EF2563 family selenium-dependent molybdenum hydroxylase system protein [Lutibacter sp. B2]|nr:EF2563 family selenium-dependent molybdenum hydroxylase system protein [Lutibacter sp. B2]